MTTATLTYDLEEEEQEHRYALDGIRYYLALWDMDQWLRSEIKYVGRVELEEVRDKLRDCMMGQGVDFDA